MYGTDAESEVSGIKVEFGEGKHIVLARAGGENDKFSRAMEIKGRPYKRQISKGTIDEKVLRKIMIEAFADTVVKGWEGMTDAAGKELPYSRENAIKLMTDLPDLFDELIDTATNSINFQELTGDEDADSGNSRKSSSTS
jgi:hypothetical protein